jgi:hypothetical protein
VSVTFIYLFADILNRTKMKKKIMVTLNEAQYEHLMACPELGDSDSEKLRNSFLIYESLKDLLQVIKKLKE